jgi:hypothetical protein
MSLEWLAAQDIEQLKAYGSFQSVRQQIDESLEGKFELKARGWQDLLAAVSTLRKLLINSGAVLSSPKHTDLEQKSTSEYFTSEESRLIYALLYLDAELRAKELGIQKLHFRDKEVAKTWRNEISKKIHPDMCPHPNAADAIAKLNELYERMVG